MISNHTATADGEHLYFFSDMSVVGRGPGWGAVCNTRGQVIERNMGGPFRRSPGILLDTASPVDVPKAIPMSAGDLVLLDKLKTDRVVA